MPAYHCFSVEIAARYGILEAVLIENIKYWVDKNRANGKNIFDGRPWTYNSVKAFTDLFPYASEGQIRRALKKLESCGLLLTGNYNKLPYDRTMWYALTDYAESIFSNCNIHFSFLKNGTCENEKPIPNINPNINPNNNNSLADKAFFDVENPVESVENSSSKPIPDEYDSLIKYFLLCYRYYIQKDHEPIKPQKLQEVKNQLRKHKATKFFVNEYFGDDGSKNGKPPLYGNSNAKIYHFASDGVLQTLSERFKKTEQY